MVICRCTICSACGLHDSAPLGRCRPLLHATLVAGALLRASAAAVPFLLAVARAFLPVPPAAVVAFLAVVVVVALALGSDALARGFLATLLSLLLLLHVWGCDKEVSVKIDT